MNTVSVELPIVVSPTARPVVRVLAGHNRRARGGYPWVYSNEIEMSRAGKSLLPGTLVTLIEQSGQALGTATFNPHTLIAARIIDRDAGTQIDRDWFAARIRRALALRERLIGAPYYRLIHSEADELPGLIADRYGDVLVLQANTAGIDRLIPEILAAFDDVIAPRAVVLRNDSGARTQEGLEAEVRVAKGAIDGPVELRDNGLTFYADVIEGQKTGWFFDQRDNRALVARLAKDARVLDAYAYLGGFGITAAHAGARAVTCIEGSAAAIALGERAAAANGVRVEFVKNEAFAEMERRGAAKESFDIVVCDPPAFVKSKKDLGAGARGYRKMARLAAALVAPGGFLFAASCSHNVDRARFVEEIARGLDDAGRSGRLVVSSGAAPDHPVHPHLPESAYLKAELIALD
jgi:23S rRNA (cytosine1962-C5)-methyltransferase